MNRLRMVATSKPGTQRESRAARIPPRPRAINNPNTKQKTRSQKIRTASVKRPIARSGQRRVGNAWASAPTLPR